MLTTTDLIDSVRAQSDEHSEINVTDQQIIDSLNRAQRKAANILARRYDELFWVSENIELVGAQSKYKIPAKAYGRRIEKLEVKLPNSQITHEVRKISNRNRTQFTQESTTTRPQYYSQLKNELELYPKPSGGQTLIIHYNTTPERLVLPQGRITNINSGSNYIVVDSLGSQVSTSTTGFNAYVNIVDYVTGLVKATMQVQSINTTAKQIVFKSSALTRTTVLGRAVSTTLPSDIQADDYICIVSGSCVAEIPEAYQDYLTQYAVLELRRRHGEPTQEEFAALKELEDELMKAWTGRESSNRVRKVSPHWGNQAMSRRKRLLS